MTSKNVNKGMGWSFRSIYRDDVVGIEHVV